jgi:UDP-N-acetylmuramoylalanine--D-glutamate ligase
VKTIYVYGATKDKMFNYLKKKNIKVLTFENLKDATLQALNDKKDEVVLYSPMFASYDQYKTYIERGKEFNKIILHYYEK